MADEEDVIFDNSPLYRHLSEVGFTDFHVETLNTYEERPGFIVNEHLKQNNNENLGNRNLKEWAINSVKRFIFGYLAYFLPSTVSEKISCYSSCVAMIKKSGLLADDDLELLYRYEQCTNTAFGNTNDTECKIKDEDNKFTKTNNSVFTSKLMIGMILLTAVILGLFLNTISAKLKIISYIFLSILFAWLLGQLFFLQAKNKIYIIKKNMALLHDYIEFTEKLLVLIRKIILFIQEKELIARGHIIVNPGAPVTRIESNIKQCMMLRKCLFLEMNNYLSLLHNKIKDISNSSFLNTNYGDLNWLAKELSRIGNESLTENENNSQGNEYSLITLKKAFATLGSKQSLLLCCTAVNLMSVIINLQQPQRKQVESCQLCGCLGDLLPVGKKCFDNLHECYKFHKVDIPAHVFDEKQGRKTYDNTLYVPFTLALRSMTLHLQQACKTSIDIEEKLDKLFTESELHGCADFDEIKRQISIIGQEIEKLNVCYEESQSRLEDVALSSSEEQYPEHIVKKEPSGSLTEQDDKDVQILKFPEEPEPVSDQIFEGETTSEFEHGNETQYSSNLGREELLIEEKMREESRHLFKELKAVLATKDEEKMVAIPKMLLKKFGAVKFDDHVEKAVESGIESSEIGAFKNDVFSSVKPEKEVKCCVDKTRTLKTCDDVLTVKEQAVNMIPAVTNPPKDSIPGSDNEEFVRNEMCRANPFASMVAAMAVARNKEFGVTEQSYEIEAETFSDETD